MEPRAQGATQGLDHQGCDALCLWPQNVLKREGFVKEQKRITPAMVRQVLDDMVPSFAEAQTAPISSEPRLSLAA